MNLDDIDEVKKLLIAAGKEDQRVRIERDANWEATDAANQKLLKQIINKYGWPTISLVGIEAQFAACNIALHAENDLPFMEKTLSLRKALPEDETQRHQTATLEDKILMHQGKPQIYGSQFTGDAETGLKLLPIEGINMEKLLAGDKLQLEILNARRKSVGLDEPIEEYILRHGISIPRSAGRTKS